MNSKLFLTRPFFLSSTSTQSKTLALAVVVCVMDMLIPAIIEIPTIPPSFSADVSTIPAVRNAIVAVPVSSRKLGDNLRVTALLAANVSLEYTLIILNKSNFISTACNCFLHSKECVYDPEIDRQHQSLDIHDQYEGGGVCQNCQHNTEGINCNRCKATFYRPYEKFWNETDVCQRKQANLPDPG